MRNVAIIGTSAIPVGKYQTQDDAALQTLEHEIMARLIIEAVGDAGGWRNWRNCPAGR